MKVNKKKKAERKTYTDTEDKMKNLDALAEILNCKPNDILKTLTDAYFEYGTYEDLNGKTISVREKLSELEGS